ncbi:MAG TPA: GTPase RsgA, partial [Polyangiales bacterium]|nr:GTPase RsgA [Polyangiales bacterium]
MEEGLRSLGWGSAQDAALGAVTDAREEVPARVVRQERARFELDTGRGRFVAAPAGRLRHLATEAAELPVIGDWVLVAQPAHGQSEGVITTLLPRKSELSRRRVALGHEAQVLAANVDVGLIVVPLDREPSLGLIDRALLMARAGKVDPLVVLSKSDACSDTEREIERVRAH